MAESAGSEGDVTGADPAAGDAARLLARLREAGPDLEDPELIEALQELDEPVPLVGGQLDRSLSQLRAQIAADEGLLGRLASLNSTTRLAILAILALLIPVAHALVPMLSRADMTDYPLWRATLAVGVLAGLAGAAAWVALRPLYRPPLPSGATTVVLAAAVVVPFMISAMPEYNQHLSACQAGEGGVFWAQIGMCTGYGVAMGFPIVLLALLLDRAQGPFRSVTSVMLGAVSGGLVANLTLELHCSVTDWEHVMMGHAPLGLVFLLLGLAYAGLTRALGRG